MNSFGRVLFVVSVLLCSGCVWFNGDDDDDDNQAWLDMLCPTSEGEQKVEDLLDAIIGWAPPAPAIGSDAKVKAEACKLHTGLTEVHCAHVVTAWIAAEQANAATDQAVKDALWTLCISELTHGSDGGGAGGAVSSWPNVECPDLSGVMASMRLQWIIDNAPPVPDVGSDASVKAQVCMGPIHTGVNSLHCMRVYAAHVFAQSAAASPSPAKEVFWTLCISELTHGSGGGGVGG